MFVTLTIAKYEQSKSWLGFLSMAIFRLPLYFTKNLSFWKLMGTGKNGTFDIHPDWQQWGLLAVWENEAAFDKFEKTSFIGKWWRRFPEKQTTFRCIPYESHGLWDGKQPFGKPIPDRSYTGPIAVLTRATIRPTKVREFWQNVPTVAGSMTDAKGFITSVGVGEVPFIKQATFSVWESMEDVKLFAYRQREHAEVIKKTRENNWYSEELFARFIPIDF